MIDSRAYRFAFLVRDQNEIPADFESVAAASDFEIGLFLPQDHADRFAQPRYIPQLLLLRGDEIRVQPHPAFNEKGTRAGLSDLVMIERAQFLLSAWIRLRTSRAQLSFPYPRREEAPVKTFLKRLAERMLKDSLRHFAERISFHTGTPSELSKAFEDDLLVKENVLLEWCSSMQNNGRSDLLALTTHRLIWVSKANELADVEEFGYRLCYTPLQQWRGFLCNRGKLRVLLQETEWTLPLLSPVDLQHVNEFTQAAEPLLEQKPPCGAKHNSNEGL